MPTNNRSQIQYIGSTTLLVDCYNANPSSMRVSINNFVQLEKTGKIVILGDMLELGEESALEHQLIVDMLIQENLKEVILIGENFCETKTPISFFKYNTVEELKGNLHQFDFENKLVLIKGSRGIRLEKVIELIK